MSPSQRATCGELRPSPRLPAAAAGADLGPAVVEGGEDGVHAGVVAGQTGAGPVIPTVIATAEHEPPAAQALGLARRRAHGRVPVLDAEQGGHRRQRRPHALLVEAAGQPRIARCARAHRGAPAPR